MEYVVKEKSLLLEFLLSNIKGKSKNNIKSILKNGNVFVNNKSITKYDFKLNINDIVLIKNIYKEKDNKLDILYEDEYLIIVNKDEKLLTVSNDKEKYNTLYRYVSNYVKSKNKNNKVFIVNRLDKDTSGIVIFSKNKVIKEKMQSNWNDIVKLRKYIAIVEGVTEKSGIIKSYLNENSEHIIYSSDNGKLAITEYKLIKTNNKYSMLDITLYTGRKNQIRVHMKDIHHPVVGDKIYSSNSNPLNRLALHSNQVSFIHPVTQKIIDVYANIPEVFNNIV